MLSPIKLRTDYSPAPLHALAKSAKTNRPDAGGRRARARQFDGEET
jgi:hypothetical protein